MFLSWLNARDATDLGRSLADHLVPRNAPVSAAQGRKPKPSDQKAMETFLQRVDREVRPLQLNLYKRAKLANSFKWRLLENRLEQSKADKLTQMLLLRLSSGEASLAQTEPPVAVPPKRANAGKVDTLLFQAIEHGAKGSHTDAMRCYQELLELNPRHWLAHNNLGAVLIKLGRYKEAEYELRQAIEIKRDYPDALCNLATVLRWRGLIVESETPLRRALKLSPQHVLARVSLGLTLILAGRLVDAKDCLEKALKLAPHHVDALVGLAEIAQLGGRFDEAEALLERALEINPRAPNALAARPRLRKMTRADAAWLEGAESVAAGSDLALMEEASLRYAIGKYCDDVRDFPRAFQNYQRANELQKMAARPYDRQARTRFVDDLIRVYTREALSWPAPGASDSERPVLVVGMMRSGTSLIEQIISSHPDAKGAGELEFWIEEARKHQTAMRHAMPSQALTKKWAEGYLRMLSSYSSDALRVVDKSNFNSDHLGIIHSTFPKARFVYVRRDPIDVCLSCYFQQFDTSVAFAMDLLDLAYYYREHRRLVDHWRAVLPTGTLLDVPYAELVADQEHWTRKILDFLGLPWDARCLNFHETQRPVLTASSWQVRQKMYKGSVGRWRNYKKFIGPLLELGGAGES